MKNLAIVCDVMKNEFEEFKRQNHNDLDCAFMEQHLHDTPDTMRVKLQEEIDKVGDEYKNIILIYGQCSNGVVGLKSDKHEIIIPKVDDCISLFLGSKERYIEEFKKDPATYYLCKGWIEYGGDPYRGYLIWTGQEDKIPKEWFRARERYGKKYDEPMAKFLITEMLKNYKRVVLINNDDIEKIHRDYAEDMVASMSDILEKEIELKEIKGSSRLLKMLVDGNWDNNEVIRIKPGQEILQEYFFSD